MDSPETTEVAGAGAGAAAEATTQNQSIYDKPITEIPITDENVALNVIVSFLNVAQKRGCFSINESAKIWECVKFFMNPSARETSDASPAYSNTGASTSDASTADSSV